MEEKKMKFHITITDNETGETLKDRDACCIIGACNVGEYTEGMALVHCSAPDLANAINGAEKSINHMKSEHPELELLLKIKHLFDDLETEDEEPEDK